MVFSGLYFLFSFLPLVLILYFLVPEFLKNLVLLLASIFFYAWGEPVYVFLMLFSAAFNFVVGLDIDGAVKSEKKKLLIFFRENIIRQPRFCNEAVEYVSFFRKGQEGAA